MTAKLVKFSGWFNLLVNDIVYATEDNGPYLRLSKSNCETIERGYDLNEYIAFELQAYIAKKHNQDECTGFMDGYEIGFQKALELLGDKKYSEENLATAYAVGYGDFEKVKNSWPKLIQSLQQTEWDVEIETVEYGLGNDQNGRPVIENKVVLDADGCLILKRIKSL